MSELVTPVMRVVRLDKDAILPKRSNPTDSGLDVCFHSLRRVYTHNGGNGEQCIEDNDKLKKLLDGESIILPYLYRVLIGTGLKATVGPGYEIQVRPRSGLALNKGLTVLNTPGTIDEAYRDEICVILINQSRKDQTISFGERIAQLVVVPILLTEVQEVTSLDGNDRQGGFGSTGA